MARDPQRDVALDALARVDPRWDAAQTERALAGMRRRATRRRAIRALGAAAMLLVLVGLGWRLSGETSAPIAERPEAAPPPDHVVHLADGSEVRPDEGADVVVQHVSDARIAVRIDRGAADVEVVPGLARRFEVRAGAVTVTVIGTAFRVERLDTERARVRVTRGHVAVAWPDGSADLYAGDEGVFPDASARALAAAPAPTRAPEVESPPLGVGVEAPALAAAARRPAAPAAQAWRELARAERYDEAYSALDASGDRAHAVHDDVGDLLLAADVARLSGHPVEALPWLEAVVREHRDDARAVLAAFTRGRILMDLGRSDAAATQLEEVVAMEPQGSLAEDALGRAVLAHAAAGHAAAASALAERYLASYPGGRWSGRVRAAVEGSSPR